MREEILELLSGKKIDSQPAFSGLIHITAEGLAEEGLALHEVHKDAEKMAKAPKLFPSGKHVIALDEIFGV